MSKQTVLPRSTEERIQRIIRAIRGWLDNEGGILEKTKEQTIAEGLFQRHDINFMIGHIRQSVTQQSLREWAMAVPEKPAAVNRILCIHPGNLPMVGLQDILAVLLSGHTYHGKLSTRDPWLPDGLLRVLRRHMRADTMQWSTRMPNLAGIRADALLFAGSGSSLEIIKDNVRELDLVGDSCPMLIRTSNFSMAWLSEADGFKPEDQSSRSTMPSQLDQPARSGPFSDSDLPGSSDSFSQSKPSARAVWLSPLVEAMLRYEGKGCRSVALVIAPVPLGRVAGLLLPAMEAYLKACPFSYYPTRGVRYWKSYLESIGKTVVQAGPVLVTDDPDMAGKEDIICWVEGDRDDVERWRERMGSRLQEVYRIGESLNHAQTPPVDWKPDGFDVLSWIIRNTG